MLAVRKVSENCNVTWESLGNLLAVNIWRNIQLNVSYIEYWKLNGYYHYESRSEISYIVRGWHEKDKIQEINKNYS